MALCFVNIARDASDHAGMFTEADITKYSFFMCEMMVFGLFTNQYI